MSRNEHAPALLQVEPGQIPEAHAITMMETRVVNAVEQSHSAELNQLLMDIGSARMASATENFSALVRISKDAHIKESKTYKSLRGTNSAQGGKMNGTWEEYCALTNRSVDAVDRGIANLKAFGAEALESMLLIGVSQRDFSKYRRLPEDERLALIDAAKAGDKDELLDLAETLISRHAKEKETLESRATEAEETAAARDDVIKAKEATISRLELRATSAERRQADFTDIEKRDYECAPLHKALSTAMLELDKMAREVAHLTQVVGGQLMRDECLHALAMVAQRAVNISEIYNLPIDRDVLLSDYSELDLRSAGLKPEALQ